MNRSSAILGPAYQVRAGIDFLDAQFSRIDPEFLSVDGSTTQRGAQNQVPARPYLIQRTELTADQWRAVMNTAPSRYRECSSTCPVEQVSWDDIQAFLTALNRRDPGKNYRLPTNAEWEYAARAGARNDFGLGIETGADRAISTPEGRARLHSHAWYENETLGILGPSVQPITIKPPNAWGLYEMQGNVAEWVSDVVIDSSRSDVSGSASNRQSQANARGASARQYRGGAYDSPEHHLRFSYRGSAASSLRSPSIGFRLVRDVPAAGAAPASRAARARAVYDPARRTSQCVPVSVWIPYEKRPDEFPAVALAPRCTVNGRVARYGSAGGRDLIGYETVAQGSAAEGPAILFIHDSLGLNDSMKAFADRLAGEGYHVLAVDLFGRTATAPADAHRLAQAATLGGRATNANIMQALRYLDTNGATSVGVVGFGYGGTRAIRFGLAPGVDLDAIVAFYGAPVTEYRALTGLRTHVFGYYADRDRTISKASLDQMKDMMYDDDNMDGDLTYDMYEAVQRGFAEPGHPNFRAPEASHAWTSALGALERSLKRW